MRLAPALGGLVVALVLAAASARDERSPRMWALAETSLVDTWFHLRGPQTTQDAVLVVLVDDDAIAAHPDLVERREGMARLLRRLWELGAPHIVLDFMIPTPEKLLPTPLTDDLRAWVAAPEPETPPLATGLLQRTEAITHGDDVLEAAMRAGEVTLAFHLGVETGEPIEELKLTRGTYGQVAPSDALPQSQSRALSSMERYAKAASRLGVITVDEHVDHTIREVKLARRHGQRHFVPLGVQMAATRLGVSRGKMAFLGGERTVRLGDREVRGDDDFSVWLNWRGRGAFPVVSAHDVLDGDIDVGGRMVIVAYNALSQDMASTPWGREPAALTHATLMDNILADDLLIRAGKPAELALVGLCGGLVVLGFLLPWRPARFLGALAGCAAAVVLPPAAFLAQGTWLPGVGALLAAFGGTLVAFTAAWLQEGSEARALRKAFAHYVSDELLAEMVKDPSLVQLAGQRRDLSILFSDIRSFTTYSERIEPLDLIGFLNHYLTPMTRAVMRNRGFVDKYIGDAVMALFGAPVPEEAHAEHACRAALDMFTGLDSVRPEAAKHGIDLAIGVGVNSGVVAVGNMGSADRLEYTVLGDAVNLASRLEGLTKTYGVFCLLGERTARALPPVFRVRRLDLVRVKGKEEPVEIFELCGDDRVTVVAHAEPEAWEAGVQAWRDGDFPAARAAFTRFRDANPDDRVAGLYLERMALLGEPPQPWDGVFTHQTK